MQPITSSKAPQAIGAYSQAIQSDKTVYLSGQIPLDPVTMQLCSEEIGPQIEQVFKNLAAVCHEAKGCLANLVKITVYLTDLAHFSTLNEIMSLHFHQPFPARVTVGVSALPRGALVEVDGIMVLE